MLALKRLSTESFAGGILAVANHTSNFSEKVTLITLLGEENSHERFIRRNLRPNVSPVFLYRRDSPTIVKRRVIENYFFTKLLEVYEINDAALAEADNETLCRILAEEVPRYDVVIVADFGHGMLTSETIRIICERAKFLAVNAQSNAGNLGYQSVVRYPRADYLSIGENEIRLEMRERRGDLRKITLDLSKRMGTPNVMVTRGKLGCLCYSDREGFYEVPALANQVFDRMGAGDAVLSITSLLVAQGAPMEIVGFVGCAVGAQAVGTIGHRKSVERVPLIKHIESLLK